MRGASDRYHIVSLGALLEAAQLLWVSTMRERAPRCS